MFFTVFTQNIPIQLNWASFCENAHYHETLFIYKSLNNLAPPDMFEYRHKVSQHHLRSSNQNELFIPRTHHNGIKYTGAQNWNSLHVKTQKAQSLKEFKQLDHRFQCILVHNLTCSINVDWCSILMGHCGPSLYPLFSSCRSNSPVSAINLHNNMSLILYIMYS